MKPIFKVFTCVLAYFLSNCVFLIESVFVDVVWEHNTSLLYFNSKLVAFKANGLIFCEGNL